jgi:hypothetical protein
VAVVTSFPKELTEAYKKAFEARNPGIKIEILNKNTTASIAYIKELPAGQRPDVMWASAPMPLRCWRKDKLLQPAPEVKNPQAPAKIGNYPLNDPENMYYGQALAGYGLMWNTRYMQANKLPAQGMGRPDQARVLRSRGHVVAFALGHHAPDGGDHAARRRLGQGLDPAAADCGQLRRRHRPQFRRA